jgi:hypothetical protein
MRKSSRNGGVTSGKEPFRSEAGARERPALLQGARLVEAEGVDGITQQRDVELPRARIIALERSDVDFKRNQITVRQSDWQGRSTR